MEILKDFLVFLIDIAKGLVRVILQIIAWLIPPQSKIYTAEFVSPKQLLKSNHHGFNLTGNRQLTLANSFRNALIIGGTGTGKSSVVLLPSLFTMSGSFVIHDPSGELYQKSAGYLEAKGYVISILNFSELSSDGYNPIKRAFTSADINKVATLLIRTALKSNDDPFWNQQAITLMSIIIHLVKTQDGLYQNLAGVRYFLTILRVNPQELETYLKRIPHHEIYLEYQAFLNLDEKVKAGVVATVLAALQLLIDSTVARVTAHDSISFEDLRTKPMAIFIQNPISDQGYYTTITSIFIEQLLQHLLYKLPKPKDLPVHFLIDEASSLYVPSLSIAVANVRKYRTSILLVLQNFSQLVSTYGKEAAQTIKANCFTKLYFTGQSLQTAMELEQSLGLAPREDKDGNVAIRPLVPKEELRTMPANRALLICGNSQPMIIKLKPYYQTMQFLKYSIIAPPRPKGPPPIIQLPNLTLINHASNTTSKPPDGLSILPKREERETPTVSSNISTQQKKEI